MGPHDQYFWNGQTPQSHQGATSLPPEMMLSTKQLLMGLGAVVVPSDWVMGRPGPDGHLGAGQNRGGDGGCLVPCC